ncbi:hypothetical protein GMST_25460 [Geomonas silvestris]|uniref:Uncharacterized protein n=1 Tax=Geomonas silvestris TaxID=2740184 RepID=A0A6V8MJP8_9BACT|nr:hypothetical protein GMST_25460 [Geomonas silvestris]
MAVAWIVTFSGKALKQKTKLPERVRLLLFQLARDIEFSGAVRGEVVRDNVSVEIIYAGTHEKAPY